MASNDEASCRLRQSTKQTIKSALHTLFASSAQLFSLAAYWKDQIGMFKCGRLDVVRSFPQSAARSIAGQRRQRMWSSGVPSQSVACLWVAATQLLASIGHGWCAIDVKRRWKNPNTQTLMDELVGGLDLVDEDSAMQRTFWSSPPRCAANCTTLSASFFHFPLRCGRNFWDESQKKW